MPLSIVNFLSITGLTWQPGTDVRKYFDVLGYSFTTPHLFATIEAYSKWDAFIFHTLSGINPIKKFEFRKKFLTKNQKILKPTNFSENLKKFLTIFFGAASWAEF
jgi:hypothetical protein